MKIAIDRNVPIPAYQQVVDGIAGAIARGDLGRGSRLPSVRNLAVDLGLNVNTVARAYRDLERAGVIDTMPGMGTFVADETLRPVSWPPSRAVARPEATALRSLTARTLPPSLAAGVPLATTWQDLLAAAHALACADGVAEGEFVTQAAEAARAGAARASLLVAGASPQEAADLLRALPADLAAAAVAVTPAELRERLTPTVAAVVTMFPGQAQVRALLGTSSALLVPVETELTEATVRSLAELPAPARIALVTVEKEHWDHEANDVMKIIGRNRWLKMVLLDKGERGLAERLENVDCILFVPRAREALRPFDTPSHTLVQLARQVTARTRERLLQALAAHA